MAVPKGFNYKGKRISFRDTGSGYEIFVNGNSSGFKRWESSSTKYSNLSGHKISHISGMDITEALETMGKIWFSFLREIFISLFLIVFFLCVYIIKIVTFSDLP